jgi:MarR family transcriptional regulator, organic hydroperoxide resistance regulator
MRTDDALDVIETFEQVMLRLVWLEQKRWAQILAAHGLTVPQFLVLAAIWERQNGCHMGELAGDMLQSSATMTGIVDRLVRMDLVHRQAVATDRRLVLIDLTERGRTVLVRVQSEKHDRLQQVLDRLPETDQRALIRLLSAYLEANAE